MDWAKAKSYVIILLFVLNVILGILNFFRIQNYHIGEKSEKAAESILSKRGVILECDLPSVYRPMKNTILKKCSYDYLVLKDIFFSSDDDVKQTVEFNDRIMYSADGSKKLIVSGDNVIFQGSLYETGDKALADEEKDKIIREITEKITKKYCVMKKLRDDYSDGVRNVVYSQQFNGYYIFNNSVSFYFEDTGKYRIKFMYCEPIEFTGPQSEIYSSSEAVYNFSSEVVKIYDMTDYIITGVQIGYFYESNAEVHESTYISKPFYRIFVEGIEQPFYINALENSFLFEG